MGRLLKNKQKQLKIKERNKLKQLKVIIPMHILMKMNYCLQRQKIIKNIYNERLNRLEELTKKQ